MGLKDVSRESLRENHHATGSQAGTAEKLRVGLLFNFNVDKLKQGIRRVIL